MNDGVIDHEARAALREHNAVCTERYGSLWSAVERIERSLAEGQTQNHARFNTISTRMWSLVVAVSGAAIICLASGGASLAFYVITHH